MDAIAPEEVGVSSDRLGRIGAYVQGLVDQGKIAGAVTLVARHGRLAHFEAHGLMDVEAGRSMTRDAVFRVYSMTKPVTAVAAMMLHEEGHFLVDDPVADFIPEFAETKVCVGETRDGMDLAELATPITIRHLLTHTSGLTYGFSDGAVARRYAEEQIMRPDEALDSKIPRLARLPLAHQPGTEWTYGASLDVLGRVVEVVSGRPFDAFLKERVFEPLAMTDTGFDVPRSSLGRVAPVYAAVDSGGLRRDDSPALDRSEPRVFLSGGGGLVSTAFDYARFAQMLANGGELDGIRLLGPRTVDLMMADHLSRYRAVLPSQPWRVDTLLPGKSYGLGGEVVVGFGYSGTARSVGSYSWGGAASTYFWVDRKEELVGLFMTQLMPMNPRPPSVFEVLVYQALIG